MIINTHVQSPCTFSPFDSIEELVQLARKEDIAALGITDTNSIDSFRKFAITCTRQGIYPLFNVKFALYPESKKKSASTETNFLQGKGLRYPASLSGDVRNFIATVWKASQDSIWKLIDEINNHLNESGVSITLDYNILRSEFGISSLTEQHLSKAVYLRCLHLSRTQDVNLEILLGRLFDSRNFTFTHSDPLRLQQEIHKGLTESVSNTSGITIHSSTHLTVQQAKRIILGAGGIPCYQCSSLSGTPPDEKPSELAKRLTEKGINAIEFIPHRFTGQTLYEYMHYFHRQGFCVTLGTIHDTFLRHSLIPVTRTGEALDETLIKISYEGACIYAAHQELHRSKRHGFVDESGNRHLSDDELSTFIALGNDAISSTRMH